MIELGQAEFTVHAGYWLDKMLAEDEEIMIKRMGTYYKISVERVDEEAYPVLKRYGLRRGVGAKQPPKPYTSVLPEELRGDR